MMESPIEQIKDTSRALQPNFVCFEISTYEEFQVYGQNGCGRGLIADAFFLSFHYLFSLFVMPVFIALIVDSYADLRRLENSFITKKLLANITEEWTNIDEEAKGYIAYRELWRFCAAFLKIYQNREGFDRADLKELVLDKSRFLERLDLNAYESEEGILCFKFHEVILSLTKICLEKAKRQRIKETKVHRIIEKSERSEEGLLRKKEFHCGHAHTLIMLKVGLRNWRHQACQKGLYTDFSRMVGEAKRRKLIFD